LDKIKQLTKEVVSTRPVVIVSGDSANESIFKSLKGCGLSVWNLKTISLEKLEVQIQSNYLEKDINNNYGVYLLNESLAVGTDIPTNADIDRHGGSFLIIADVLSKCVEE
jgi:hypothetical protein